MRAPKPKGTAINQARFNAWKRRFGSYRDAVTRDSIEEWLGQFSSGDRDLAARVLDVVEFYGDAQIRSKLRSVPSMLPGWNKDKNKRKGRWRFAALSGSAGESGDNMLYYFRMANNLDGKSFNELFVGRSDLPRQGLGNDDSVVLFDDLSATGTQACEAWNDPAIAYGELLAGVGSVFLVLIAATSKAEARIRSETDFRLIRGTRLAASDNIFSDACARFDGTDKAKLKEYCERASRVWSGYGEGGLVVVFQHRTPNNSIPILHASAKNWTPLFPRHD